MNILCPDCNNKQMMSDLYKEELGTYVVYFCFYCFSPKIIDIKKGEMINSQYQIKLLEL